MKLAIITEAIQGLQTASEKLDIPIEQLDQLLTDADPTGRKYKSYILKLLLKQNIRLPEDNYRIRKTLENFDKYQRNLEVKDILKYNSLHELETALEPYLDSVSKRQGGNNLNPLNLPGVELINSVDEYKVYKVSNAESLKDIGEGTKWCTRRSYPVCQAERYINTYRWLGVIYKDNKPFIQYTPDYDQIMDVNDLVVANKKILQLLIPKPKLEDANGLFEYSKNIIQGRWPEAEPIIAQNKLASYNYAAVVMKDRWPEIEHHILNDYRYIPTYARYCIKDRWPEGEKRILASYNPQYIYEYARYVINGEWPEAEGIMSNSPEYAYMYASYVVGKRWPKGEPTIARDPDWAYHYAKDVLDDRWPEGEEAISKSRYWHRYCQTFDIPI